MRTLRMLLSLLLCLTVPVAGWASVLSGPACPAAHAAIGAHHHSAGKPGHHHSHGAEFATGQVTTGHQHGHRHPASTILTAHNHASCEMLSGHHGSCKGDHCSCGCGMGACTAPAFSLATTLPILLLARAHDAAVVFADVPPHAFACDALPLRPPIS